MKIQAINTFRVTHEKNKTKSIPFSAKINNKSLNSLTHDVFEIAKTEKEKMLSGLMYTPSDKQLHADKAFAQDLWYKYNQLHPSLKDERVAIIKKLFGKTGERFRIEQDFKCDYGYNIEIGENFFSNYNLTILDTAKVKFGDNVLVGPNCGFYTAEHPFDPILRATGQQIAKPINVGNSVWFGGNVTVLGGVNIGDNVIVGAGSVVNKDLPPDTLCCGVPCKVIKKLK